MCCPVEWPRSCQATSFIIREHCASLMPRSLCVCAQQAVSVLCLLLLFSPPLMFLCFGSSPTMPPLFLLGSSDCLAAAILRHIVCLFRFGSKYIRNNNRSRKQQAHSMVRWSWPQAGPQSGRMAASANDKPCFASHYCCHWHKIIIIARYCAIDLSFNAEFIRRADEWKQN